MKISGIDKDFEDIIYDLDSKGFKPYEMYGNIISGTTYNVHFHNKKRVLEENSDFDLSFSVSLNGQYQPHMEKIFKINELIITTKSGNERVDGDVIIHTERDMEVLASI